MEPIYCSSIKESLIHRFAAEVEVTSVANQCVFTLPLKTLDDRLADVFVEQKMADVFLVHDAGMTTSQLYAQGVHVTEAKSKLFAEMARRLGAVYENGMFQVVCKSGEIESSILAISQCVMLGMFEILGHKPVFEEEPVPSRVQRTLNAWKPDAVASIGRRVPVVGTKAKHEFDFVAFPKEPSIRTVAVNILNPSYSPKAQSQRYGFLVLDTEKTIYANWNRLAIVARAEDWGNEPLKLVRSLASSTLELKTGEEQQIEDSLPQIMNTLIKAA